MPGTNLDIGVSATTKQARAEFELLTGQVRILRKEVKAAREEAAQGGSITPRLESATAELLKAEAGLLAYRKAARATTAANVEASASFAELNKNVAGFARGAAQGIGGIKGLRAGLAAMVGAGIIQSFSTLIDKVTELSDTSKKTGFSTSTIQAFGLALEKTGGHAEDAKGILEKLGSQVKLTFDIYGKAALTAGDGTDEFSKALQALNINISQFKLGTAAGLDQFLISVAQALVRLNQAGRIDEANVLSTAILGKNYREIGAALAAVASGGGLDALKQTLTASGQLTSQEQLDRINELNASIKEMTRAWSALVMALGEVGVFQVVGAGLMGIAEAIKAIAHAFDFSGSGEGDFGGGGPAGMASGGYVRGPGSGTSDSILARLSNGEFVMRRAAVDRWGPAFLSALNNMRNPFGSFASGGLVRTPRFAGGGMVTAMASDGTPVHLHFPGGQFQLRGDRAVVESLTREARRAGMLSAGRLPGLA